MKTKSIVNLSFAVVYAHLSVSIKTFGFFFNSRNRKSSPFSLLENFVYSFVSKCSFKTLAKRENVVTLLSTTTSHRTLMDDSVQWLSQSDYSICISMLAEFY